MELFREKKRVVRDFFEFRIYAVESSCGMSVPIMEYKDDREELRDWAVNMDEKGTLEEYKEKHKENAKQSEMADEEEKENN
mgnify:CR=1 FL=1